VLKGVQSDVLSPSLPPHPAKERASTRSLRGTFSGERAFDFQEPDRFRAAIALTCAYFIGQGREDLSSRVCIVI
jgi:hypothetical protein